MNTKLLFSSCLPLMAVLSLSSCDDNMDSIDFSFKEPIPAYGSPKSVIKSQETRKLDSETSNILKFKGENAFVAYCSYVFDTFILMEGAVLQFSYYNEVTVNGTKDYLEQHYTYMGISSDLTTLIYYNTKSVVGVSHSSSLGFHLTYIPNTPTKTIYDTDIEYYIDQFKKVDALLK